MNLYVIIDTMALVSLYISVVIKTLLKTVLLTLNLLEWYSLGEPGRYQVPQHQ